MGKVRERSVISEKKCEKTRIGEGERERERESW